MKPHKNSSASLPPLLVYDGVCVLCNRWVNYVLEKDHQQLFIFSSYQGLPASISKEGAVIPMDQSVSLFIDGQWFQESTAILKIFEKLYGPYHWSQLAYIFPRFLRNFVYRQIAKRRYKWFGKYESCRLPNAGNQTRFIG
ncbi:MAG: hypothetical protein RLZZ65_1110 [Bacteroidota bacterium]|jgi:predicted DCC family thiol-disulfide oxidoreductase YuxK